MCDYQACEMKNDQYHESVCGSILLPLSINNPSKIFSYIHHGKFDQFQQCFNIYHQEIINMKNEHRQTILHLLTIHAYPYQWIRVLLMRGCDPCWQDDDGYTAVHYAIERNDLEILKSLTTRFSGKIKSFSEEKINDIHGNCLKALTLRQKDGLTGFMLACFHQSLKCLNYLLQLQINDVHLQDNYGDTCLHYAVSRRNKVLINQLLDQCQANVNGGDPSRPSVLDIIQFNRNIDDSIEQILLSHNALNHCHVHGTVTQHKRSTDNEEFVDTDFRPIDSRIRIARNYARLAFISKNNGDLTTSENLYRCAMNIIPNDTFELTHYAYQLAMIYITREEYQNALDLLQQILTIRKQLKSQTEDINQIECIIKQISS